MTARTQWATLSTMARTINANASALRAALESTLPDLQLAAAWTVRRALESHETVDSAAASLGVSPRVLRRLREKTQDFETQKKDRKST